MGNDPYFREDPGIGHKRVDLYKFDLDSNPHLWKPWRTNDGRILPNNLSNFEVIENPFDYGKVLILVTNFNPAVSGKHFGGFGMRSPITPSISVDSQTFVEFDLYYPMSAGNKYMRLEIWSTSTGGEGLQANAGTVGEYKAQVYIRSVDLDGIHNFNLDNRCGYYKDETWFKKHYYLAVPVSSGIWEYLNIDIHTESNAKVDNGLLMIGNVKITQTDPQGKIIPLVVNDRHYLDVEPVKKNYHPDNGTFLVGTIETGSVDPLSIRGYHFNIFVDENNLKPECHKKPPKFLIDEYPSFIFRNTDEEHEWDMPTEAYKSIRDSGNPGEYKMHGHTLTWGGYQTPQWMRQIVPQNITSMEWRPDGKFYSGGVNAIGPFQKVAKDTARRVNFNHVVYVLRHFMSTDARYDSNKERGIIPFFSFDLLNVEIHESRHSDIISEKPGRWKTILKNLSWLMAMTDDDFDDLRQHYVYLLFKFAHIAVPNVQMAQKFKEHYNDPDIVPVYMKLDGHDDNGSIDAFVADVPILVFNDNDFSILSKARIARNMIRELNVLWKTDPLYDGRNLIECMGIQGHEMVSPTLASQYKTSLALFTGLIDEGLLDSICFSEMDMRQPDTAPGGGAIAPEALNQKQADAIAYQYALLFKLFNINKKYISKISFWGQCGGSWLGNYLLFDHEQKASQAYYAIMNPDKFIQGHSYLDSFFAGEYEKIKEPARL